MVGTSRGTITNEQGLFKLRIDKLSIDSRIRFSMIGYESQTFALSELKNQKNSIELKRRSTELKVVTVKPTGKSKIIGTKKISRFGVVCGWGGTDFAKGHEIGLPLDLGNNTVKIESFNFRVYKQSFDTILFRLHIRSIKDGLPDEELLREEIFISLSDYKGWQQIDLTTYDLYERGTIVISIEWVKISGVNEQNLVKVNRSKQPTANVLFNLNTKDGTFYMRRGSEAKWQKIENQSPCFYIIVQE